MRHLYKVYRNLHKGCFSILKWNEAKKGYRVFLRESNLIAYSAEFRVSQAGRLRVLHSKQKNVHAYVLCHDIEVLDKPDKLGEEVYYNPYTTSTFIVKKTGEAIRSADEVIFNDNKCYLKHEKL